MENVKPNFGASNTQTNNTGKTRTDVGAIWKRNSKKTGDEFLSIKVSLTKTQLEKMLASVNGEKGDFNFVAFSNSYKNNDSQPSFRIFEDNKTTNE